MESVGGREGGRHGVTAYRIQILEERRTIPPATQSRELAHAAADEVQK